MFFFLFILSFSPAFFSLFRPQVAAVHNYRAATPTSIQYSPHQKPNCLNFSSDLKLQNLILLDGIDNLSPFNPQATEPPPPWLLQWRKANLPLQPFHAPLTQQQHRKFVNKISIESCASKNDVVILRKIICRRSTTAKWDRGLGGNGTQKWDHLQRRRFGEGSIVAPIALEEARRRRKN